MAENKMDFDSDVYLDNFLKKFTECTKTFELCYAVSGSTKGIHG